MKKYFSLLIIGLLLTECSTSQVENEKNKIPTDTQAQTYHEIETTLTSDIDFSSVVPKEISKLQEKGEIFWHNQNYKIQGRTKMYYLRGKIECKNGGYYDCSIIVSQADKNNLPPEFTTEKRDSGNWRLITKPKLHLINNIKQIAEFYIFGKDVYVIVSLEGDDNYSIFKNYKEIFFHKMFFGAESVIEDARIVLNSPTFTFYDLKEWKDENTPVVKRNIWYNNETINEKFSVEASSYLFAYKDKIGFVGERDGKKFLFFNSQKISQDFDEIRTYSCCDISAYPIELDENGILFFLAKRGEKYFFVEINLNEYLK